MPPQNSQPDMTPEEAKASLGIATFLQQQHLDSQAMQQPIETPQTQEMPQGNEEAPQNEEPAPQEEKEPEPDLKAEFEGFKGEIKGIIETKIDDLTKTIKDALKED